MCYVDGCSSRGDAFAGVGLRFSDPGREVDVACFVGGSGGDASDAVSACVDVRDTDIRATDHSILGNNTKIFVAGYVGRVHCSYAKGGEIFMPTHPAHMDLVKVAAF